MPPAIHYVSHGYTSGYGVAGFRLLQALDRAGVSLRWSPIAFDSARLGLPEGQQVRAYLRHLREAPVDADVVIVHAVPEMIPAVRERFGIPRSTPVLCHTVWETDRLQAHWAGLLNDCDGVIVPTAWNAEVFRASGVHVPIAVVPHVRDDLDRASDDAWLRELGDRFLVYSVAAWDGRKAPWRAMEAVGAAFPGDHDVVYVLKTDERTRDYDPRFGGTGPRRHDTMIAVARLLGELGSRAPQVQLVTRYLYDREVRGLHQRGDVWCSLPHAEGWDVGAFDAAVTGTPVVTTGWGAPAEYLDPTLSQLVPGRIVDVQVPPHPPEPEHHWVEPDLDAAVDALRWARDHHDEAGARAAAQADRLRARYAPDVVARELLDAVSHLLA